MDLQTLALQTHTLNVQIDTFGSEVLLDALPGLVTYVWGYQWYSTLSTGLLFVTDGDLLARFPASPIIVPPAIRPVYVLAPESELVLENTAGDPVNFTLQYWRTRIG